HRVKEISEGDGTEGLRHKANDGTIGTLERQETLFGATKVMGNLVERERVGKEMQEELKGPDTSFVNLRVDRPRNPGLEQK
ncbi:MAG: hypothetical protein ACREV3_08860, partial [Gammaproteobacteria bacterium]